MAETHWTLTVPKTAEDVLEAIINLESSITAGAMVREYDRKLRVLANLAFELRTGYGNTNTQTFAQLLRVEEVGALT